MGTRLTAWDYELVYHPYSQLKMYQNEAWQMWLVKCGVANVYKKGLKRSTVVGVRN